MTLGDGDPDRIATLFERWEDASVVTREGRGWVYASEREAARGRSGIDIRRELLLSFAPPDDPASVAGYERAVATLGVAALEGMVFTVGGAGARAGLRRGGAQRLARRPPRLRRRPSTRAARRRRVPSRSPGPARSIATRSGTACSGARSADTQPPHGAPLRRGARERLRPVLDRGDRTHLGPGAARRRRPGAVLLEHRERVRDCRRTICASSRPRPRHPRTATRARRSRASGGSSGTWTRPARRSTPTRGCATPSWPAHVCRPRRASSRRTGARGPGSTSTTAWPPPRERSAGTPTAPAATRSPSALEGDPVAASRRALSLAERLLELIAQDCAGETPSGAPADLARRRQRNARDARDRPAPSATTVIEGLPEDVRSHDEAHLRHTGALLAALGRRLGRRP